jgi:hypothetical protein
MIWWSAYETYSNARYLDNIKHSCNQTDKKCDQAVHKFPYVYYEYISDP